MAEMRYGATLSFPTPYWSGREMMRIHLGSIRERHPSSPILVSKRGGEHEEMEAHRTEFGVRYWLEECDYTDALLRLLERCDTEYVCIIEHDTVLLSSLDSLLAGIREGRWGRGRNGGARAGQPGDRRDAAFDRRLVALCPRADVRSAAAVQLAPVQAPMGTVRGARIPELRVMGTRVRPWDRTEAYAPQVFAAVPYRETSSESCSSVARR